MSSDQSVISVRNVSKCFYTYDKPHDRLKQAIVPRFQRWAGDQVTTYGKEFWALRDISFEVKKRRNGRYCRSQWIRQIHIAADHLRHVDADDRRN